VETGQRAEWAPRDRAPQHKRSGGTLGARGAGVSPRHPCPVNSHFLSLSRDPLAFTGAPRSGDENHGYVCWGKQLSTVFYPLGAPNPAVLLLETLDHAPTKLPRLLSQLQAGPFGQ
jgi:hypothetical protein